MRLSRIVLQKSLGNDVTAILIAVKMQSSKRILRSNEIVLSPNGLLDTELDLTFSLQVMTNERDESRLSFSLFFLIDLSLITSHHTL